MRDLYYIGEDQDGFRAKEAQCVFETFEGATAVNCSKPAKYKYGKSGEGFLCAEHAEYIKHNTGCSIFDMNGNPDFIHKE